MDYTVCSGDRPYCLNEIVYQNGNWTKTLHRCASRVECYWDYWIGTGNGTDCIQNGVCTYCCQGPDGKPCNTRTEKPTNLTNFGQTQNRAYKCAVTGPQNSNTIQDCPPSERFCLNDVYYDTVPNTNNLITRDVRRCASQEQCKGKWLQSRKTDACLTGNMTGVDASKTENSLLCHYCCESNATTPCNLHPKPDQIKLFIQPTTIPIVSTSLPVVSTSLPAVSSTFLTNATTIMTTNSTTISTTAGPTTPTTPKAKVYCHQCGDTSNGIPCSSRQVTTSQPKECNGAYQYCMTDILQDSNGNADVYKRCVTDHICRKEWIVESADEDYCKRYGVVTNPSAFNCHFCCTSDGCNSGLVPNSTTWYKLHN
ncbi:Hypothetical predicted protein [Mytilus galloprovincialis]|uniref:Uncharacterized protein n=1 Tax=Mytilus galloprovincialis TaxID=29158 RepID=A0A8B6ENC9_MYTGA|nr:Hypothetical predicted protein [Mytilus galloprovincialis]